MSTTFRDTLSDLIGESLGDGDGWPEIIAALEAELAAARAQRAEETGGE